MSAFETLLKIPAEHPVEVLLDPDDGSVIIAQRGVKQVVQIPAEALESVARSIGFAAKFSRGA